MRLALLANRERSFILPMAKGLERMLNFIGCEADIFYDGLSYLSLPTTIMRSFKDLLLNRNNYFKTYVKNLESYDAVIVIQSIPTAFIRNFRIEELRKILPGMPIVNYSNYYLPTRGAWNKWLKEGSKEHGISAGNFGIERYDWYLVTSVISEHPMPRSAQPYSCIGVNLDDGTLYPEQKEFIALVDFERKDFLNERCTQLEALEDTNTKYIILEGSYSIEDIRAIYRQCSIYFIAHRESFGIPIAELQACGAYIFTPYSYWCPSHWLKEDVHTDGPGKLTPNFIIYDNNKEKLKMMIEQIKHSYDSEVVLQKFLTYQSHFYYGDLNELTKFIQMLKTGSIHSLLHNEHIDKNAPRDNWKRYHSYIPSLINNMIAKD